MTKVSVQNSAIKVIMGQAHFLLANNGNFSTTLPTFSSDDPLTGTWMHDSWDGVLQKSNMVYAFAGGSLTGDQEYYIRIMKGSYLFYNNGPPCYVKVFKYRCRRSISTTDFASMSALLNDETTILKDLWNGPLTTSQSAVRFLKFLKVTTFKLPAGGIKMLSFKTRFNTSNVYNVHDSAATSAYLAYKGDYGIFVKVIPPPWMNTAATPPLIPQGWNVSVAATYYQSGYLFGNNNPATSTALVTTAPTGTFQNVFITGSEPRWTPTFSS